MKNVRLIVVCLLSSTILAANADNKKVEPEQFVGDNGVLETNELKEYRIQRKQLRPNTEETERAVRIWLHDLERRLHKPPPYSPDEVVRGEGRSVAAEEFSIPGVFREEWLKPPFGQAWGPFKLRKTPDDWAEDVADVNGAMVSYESDRIAENHTWSSEGALIYPMLLAGTASETRSYSSHEWLALPAIVWNLSDISGSTNDIEDLQFQVPIEFSGNRKPFWGIEEWRDELTFAPFFQTDFHFEGQIVGALLTYDVGFQYKHFDVGQWHSIGGSKVAYLLKIQPKLEYSYVLKSSRFIERPEDDKWLRGGASLEAGIRPFGRDANWELKVLYTFLWDFAGGHDAYNDLFEARTTYWFNQNAGITFSFQKGETPVSDKDVDLLRLGLEVKL